MAKRTPRSENITDSQAEARARRAARSLSEGKPNATKEPLDIHMEEISEPEVSMSEELEAEVPAANVSEVPESETKVSKADITDTFFSENSSTIITENTTDSNYHGEIGDDDFYGEDLSDVKYDDPDIGSDDNPEYELDDELNDEDYDGLNYKERKAAEKAARPERFKLWPVIAAAGAVVLLAGIYIGGSFYFKDKFLPGTTINGQDIGMMTAEEAAPVFNDIIESGNGLEFKVIEKDGTETIRLDDADYKVSLKSTPEEMIESQNTMEWPVRLFSAKELEYGTETSYDKNAFEKAVRNLDAFDKKKITKSKNASLVTDSNGKHKIQPETYGNELDEEKAVVAILKAMEEGLLEIDLNKLDLYKKPTVLQDDSSLTKKLKEYQAIGENKITIDLTGATEVLKSEDIAKLGTVQDETFTLDEKKLAKYVDDLADKYDTYMKPRNFVTTRGDTILVGGSILGGENGDTYGFLMNREETVQILKKAILAKKDQTVRPSWDMKGNTRDKVNGDIGHTYVEISISEQHLWYYVNGAVVLDTNVVTGMLNVEKRNSPEGVYKVLNKLNNIRLKGTMDGESWDNLVEYWLGVTWTAVGMHDAPWRSYFGEDEYIWGGSHGCINVPYSVMQELWTIIEEGTPVIIYSFTNDHVNALGSHATVDYTEDEPYEEPVVSDWQDEEETETNPETNPETEPETPPETEPETEPEEPPSEEPPAEEPPAEPGN